MVPYRISAARLPTLSVTPEGRPLRAAPAASPLSGVAEPIRSESEALRAQTKLHTVSFTHKPATTLAWINIVDVLLSRSPTGF
jgi:hypothetical protein